VNAKASTIDLEAVATSPSRRGSEVRNSGWIGLLCAPNVNPHVDDAGLVVRADDVVAGWPVPRRSSSLDRCYTLKVRSLLGALGRVGAFATPDLAAISISTGDGPSLRERTPPITQRVG
jgi:hypothetical protein